MLGIFYNYRGWQGTNHPDGHFKWLYISRILIDSLDTNSSQPEALPRYDASEHIPGDFSLCQYLPENAEHPRHESPDIWARYLSDEGNAAPEGSESTQTVDSA